MLSIHIHSCLIPHIQPCALDFYKSKEDKKLLLDAALKTLDGNCITKVRMYICVHVFCIVCV